VRTVGASTGIWTKHIPYTGQKQDRLSQVSHYFTFSWPWLSWTLSSGMWRHAVWWKLTDVSEERTISIFTDRIVSLNSKTVASRLLIWMPGALSSEVKRPRQKADKSPHCSDNITNESSYTSTLP
jgi:hypothetical protein